MTYKYPLPDPQIEAASVSVSISPLKAKIVVTSPFDTPENINNAIDLSAFDATVVTKEVTGEGEVHVNIDLSALGDPNQADETIQNVYDKVITDLTNWANGRIDLIKTTGMALKQPVTKARLILDTATDTITTQTLILLT